MSNTDDIKILARVVVVGSKLHGLNHPGSDTDTVVVYTKPVKSLLMPKVCPFPDSWKEEEGRNDTTYWEIEHFLQLGRKCSPSSLEALAAEPEETSEAWEDLRTNYRSLLSVPNALDTYFSFSRAMFHVAEDPNAASARREKSLRHAWRVTMQYFHLHTTGDLI